jgi:hypothetical protein
MTTRVGTARRPCPRCVRACVRGLGLVRLCARASDTARPHPPDAPSPQNTTRAAPAQAAPHIYALAEKAYAALISSGVNQAFVIRWGDAGSPVRLCCTLTCVCVCVVVVGGRCSGESGAGKTESMKFICRCVCPWRQHGDRHVLRGPVAYVRTRLSLPACVSVCMYVCLPASVSACAVLALWRWLGTWRSWRGRNSRPCRPACSTSTSCWRRLGMPRPFTTTTRAASYAPALTHASAEATHN